MPFTASVIERRFAYVPDKILCLGGASWLRPFSLCESWGRLRIGVLCAVSPNGTSNISDALFLLGMCAGQTAPGSAYSTDNFVGASIVGAATTGATRLLTYTAGSGNPYYSATAGVAFRKQDTTFITTSAAFASAVNLPLANTGFYPRRTIIIIDINRTVGGSGGLNILVYSANTTAVLSDLRPDHLFEALDQPGVPSVRQLTFNTNLTTTAVTYSPINGDVDTLEVFWSKNAFPLEISAIGATCWRTLSYGDTGLADDTFETYAVSSGSITSELDGGIGWTSTGTINSLITGNAAPQIYSEYVGTTYCPDETFEQYVTGTVDSGTTINLGTFWSDIAIINPITANYVPQVYVEYAGTNLGAYDGFESYGTGAVISGVTINAGSLWSNAGSIY